MTQQFAYACAPIVKTEKQDDGTLLVTGRAADSSVDSDLQIIDPTALDAMFKGFMESGPNIREQHDPKRAVGVGLTHWKSDDGGHYLTSRIVDPVAVAKCEAGVLRAYSVGIANPQIVADKAARGGRVVMGPHTTLVEVSIVDRPANPNCSIMLGKSADGGEFALLDAPELVESEPDVIEKTAEPTVVANPDDPDAADPEALEKAKKGGGKKAPPFTADDKPKTDDSGDDSDESDDEDDEKKPAASKAATGGLVIAVKDGSAFLDDDTLAKAIEAVIAKRAAPEVADPGVEKAAEPDLVKAGADDEMADIARARRILADLAVLVQSEASGFLEGNDCEIWDIRALSDVMAQIQFFVEHEEYEMAEAARAAGDATAPSEPADKAATPDLPAAPEAPAVGTPPIVLKSAGSVADEINRRIEKRLKKARKAIAAQNAAETDTDVTKTATPDTPAEDTPVSHGLTFDDLTKALGPLAERLAKVQADNEQTKATLEKVLASPRPGGPAVTRVQPAVSPADAAEKAEKAAQARIVKAMIAANPTPEYRASLMAQLAELEPPAAA